MINFFTLFYTLILLILNPITLNLIFDNKMYGQIFTPALIIFDLIIFLLAYLTFKNKNKLDSIIVFFSFIILMVICEVAAGKFMYGKKNSFDVIFKEPVFFEDEKQNFRQKYYKCALKKADYYHKLYFFSAPKNLDCGGWSTIKSKNGPWVRNTINFKMNKKPKLKLGIKRINKNSFKILTKNGEVFGPQPFLAIKFKNGRYMSDNLDFGLNKKIWYYTLNEDTVLLKDIKVLAVGAADKFGNYDVCRYFFN